MIDGASCSSWASVCVRTAPRVPTGMNTGVSTVPCSVVSEPRRAREPVAVARSWNVTRPVVAGAVTGHTAHVRCRIAVLVCLLALSIGGHAHAAVDPTPEQMKLANEY